MTEIEQVIRQAVFNLQHNEMTVDQWFGYIMVTGSILFLLYCVIKVGRK